MPLYRFAADVLHAYTDSLMSLSRWIKAPSKESKAVEVKRSKLILKLPETLLVVSKEMRHEELSHIHNGIVPSYASEREWIETDRKSNEEDC